MAAKKAAKSASPAPKKAAKTSAAKPKAAPAAAPAAASAPAPAAAAAPGRDAIYPIVDRTPWGIIALILGILGLGGVGTIIAGVINKQHMVRDIVFGALQILIPFAGWAWGLVWGILIFVKGNK